MSWLGGSPRLGLGLLSSEPEGGWVAVHDCFSVFIFTDSPLPNSSNNMTLCWPSLAIETRNLISYYN